MSSSSSAQVGGYGEFLAGATNGRYLREPGGRLQWPVRRGRGYLGNGRPGPVSWFVRKLGGWIRQ